MDKAIAFSLQLSGRQKQRLAIARTLALNPNLTKQVATQIKEISNEGKIVLLTTHDTQLVELIDGDLFLLKNGTFAERTSRKEFRTKENYFPLLYHFLQGE